MEIQLDKWQQQVLNTKGNICLRSGRQVGKSTVISIKVAEYALNHPNKTVMVIASVERQAQLLFEKILSYVYDKDKKQIRKAKDRKTGQYMRPTKSRLNLMNGSTIHCLPTGESGYGIRGFTIDLLVADEAAFIPEDVWTAVTPMLTITRGNIILLSTPHGREGFYYRCFQDEKYTAFHISSEDCPRKDQSFLDSEKEWMTKVQYAQEYLGEFIDELQQFFSEEVIRKAMILEERDNFLENRKYYLGVDIARMGADETTFEVIDATNKKALEHVEHYITTKTLTTDTTRLILSLDDKYKFKKIYIDSAGVGAGVLDQLLENKQTRRKVVPIENAFRSLERSKGVKKIKSKAKFVPEKKKKALKEDLYTNLLRLMERGEVKLLSDPEIRLSLKSIQYEYTDNKKMLIHGNYSHIAEGLIRAAWCVKDKSLNIYIY